MSLPRNWVYPDANPVGPDHHISYYECIYIYITKSRDIMNDGYTMIYTMRLVRCFIPHVKDLQMSSPVTSPSSPWFPAWFHGVVSCQARCLASYSTESESGLRIRVADQQLNTSDFTDFTINSTGTSWDRKRSVLYNECLVESILMNVWWMTISYDIIFEY